MGWIKRFFYKYNKVSLSKNCIKDFSTSSSYQINRKKDHDKTMLKNWRPVSLFNVDLKIVAELKIIGLISNILSVTNNLIIKSYLVTMDIEKAFDSLNYAFLISV